MTDRTFHNNRRLEVYEEQRAKVTGTIEKALNLYVVENLKLNVSNPQRPTLQTYTYTAITTTGVHILKWDVEYESKGDKVVVQTFPSNVSAGVGFALCPLRAKLIRG